MALDCASERWPGVVVDDRPQRVLDRAGLDLHGRDRVPERLLERPLERLPRGEQVRIPLPAGIDACEAPVVKLVAGVEGQVEVVVAQRIGRVDERCLAHARWAPKRGEDRVGYRPARHGKDGLRRRPSRRGRCHRSGGVKRARAASRVIAGPSEQGADACRAERTAPRI